MCKFIKTLIIIVFLAATVPVNVKAESIVGINELIEDAKGYDGQEVTIQGEAIGESLERGNYTWVNVNDGTNAIGIWLEKSKADKILYYGDYDHKGDTVKIKGIFYKACKEHGGESDLHGYSLEIVEAGYQVKEQISSLKIIGAVILTIVASLIMLYFVRIIKSRKL